MIDYPPFLSDLLKGIIEQRIIERVHIDNDFLSAYEEAASHYHHDTVTKSLEFLN
jgi:hypothetical protein